MLPLPVLLVSLMWLLHFMAECFVACPDHLTRVALPLPPSIARCRTQCGGKTTHLQYVPIDSVRVRARPEIDGAQRRRQGLSIGEQPSAVGTPHPVWHRSPCSHAVSPKEYARADAHGMRSTSRTDMSARGASRHNFRHGSHWHVLDGTVPSDEAHTAPAVAGTLPHCPLSLALSRREAYVFQLARGHIASAVHSLGRAGTVSPLHGPVAWCRAPNP